MVCIFILLVVTMKGWTQSQNSEKKIILEFLTYVASKDWIPSGSQTTKYFDTLTNKYLIFYKNDTTNIGLRTIYLLNELKRLGKQIRQVNKANLQIVPYDEAPDSLQIMRLSPAFRERSYIAFDRTGSFRRYLLMEGGKIDAFVLWGKTAFAKLN